jgi:hypothetical protein
LDISSIPVPLSLPLNNLITNNDSVIFTWQSIPNADAYNIEINDGSWGTPYSTPGSISSTTYTEVLPEGTYVWAVSGFNNTTLTSTAFANPPRSLIIDTTAPDTVTLIYPNHNEILGDTIPHTYSWTQAAQIGGGTPTDLVDYIYFYSDSGISIIGSAIPIPTGTYQHTDSIGYNHYWRVLTEDAANNVSALTDLRKVIIQ